MLRSARRRARAAGARAVRVYRAVNTAASPLSFEIDGREVLSLIERIEGEGLELGAIYHSHTRTPPYPSQTDINFAAHWPGVEWLIVGLSRSRSARGALLSDRRRPGARSGDLSRRGIEGVRLSGVLVCPACSREYPESERFCRDCAMPLVHAAGDAGRARTAARRAVAARAQDQAAVRRGGARACRRRAQSDRGRLHPGPAARGGHSRACSAARAASTCPTSWRPARATCSSPSPARPPRETCCCRVS